MSNEIRVEIRVFDVIKTVVIVGVACWMIKGKNRKPFIVVYRA